MIRYPELFERILLEGHAVGNHTMNHDKATNMSFTSYKKSISDTHLLVKSPLFRPPYGRLKIWQSYLLSKEYKIIMWSWLSYDYDPKVSIDLILKKAKKQISEGDILVLHDNDKVKERVKILLPKLVKIIRAKFFDFSLVN